jgi:hypothetical protein
LCRLARVGDAVHSETSPTRTPPRAQGPLVGAAASEDLATLKELMDKLEAA